MICYWKYDRRHIWKCTTSIDQPQEWNVWGCIGTSTWYLPYNRSMLAEFHVFSSKVCQDITDDSFLIIIFHPSLFVLSTTRDVPQYALCVLPCIIMHGCRAWLSCISKDLQLSYMKSRCITHILPFECAEQANTKLINAMEACILSAAGRPASLHWLDHVTVDVCSEREYGSAAKSCKRNQGSKQQTNQPQISLPLLPWFHNNHWETRINPMHIPHILEFSINRSLPKFNILPSNLVDNFIILYSILEMNFVWIYAKLTNI